MSRKFEKITEIRELIKSQGKFLNDFPSKGEFPPGSMNQKQIKEYLSKNLTPDDYDTPELNDMSLPQLRY